MTLRLIIRKIRLRKDSFITRDEVKEYCNKLKLNYSVVIGYLLRHDYVVRIFRGIFYINSIEERKLKKINIDHLTAIKKALEIKGVKNWYFGLETAIKLNNLTHEYFTIDYLISDKISRTKLMDILGYKIRFMKIDKKYFSFGVIKNKFNYSDPEKTVLDLIYLGKNHGLVDEEIKGRIIDLVESCSEMKLKMYLKYYPKTVEKFIKEFI